MEKIPVDQIEVDIVDVNSSNVSRIGYNKKWVVLAIEMLNGHLFYYLDVPIDIYDGLLHTQKAIAGVEITSIGSYMNLYLKGKYRFVQIK